MVEQIREYDVFVEIGKSELKDEWVEHYAIDDQPDIRLVEGEFKQLLESLGFKEEETTYREMLEAVVVAKKDILPIGQ